ncbi:ThuA domain-containing protein [Nesterenkonia xinjiangensis]|uniref:Trehalose utilization protein n=1 Tax=Nesterenkonia xinjiangensis TaxID=225327 RepID=A0A7Z0K9T0_9MICC|nr:ThuA domain-containing protein [Nesterenkonia xinjiangensis]NYJ79069.1 trehalose utilization protein [Nesterenkonia xinjiangensis]
MPESPLRILVWNEGVHEELAEPEHIGEIYPEGMHGAIAAGLRKHLPEAEVATATLSDVEHGLTEERLARTDVLLWWGHRAHDDVGEEIVDRVHRHVLAGMGLLVLHSGHFAKVFQRLMGTTCSLAWRNRGERELVWTVNPTHPIAEGIPNPLIVPEQEMYGEFFDVPEPESLIFISSFAGGEVFRSGLTYSRGHGRIFYFSPGDQDYPVYHQAEIQRVLANGVRWAARPGHGREAPAVSNPAHGWFDESHAGAGASPGNS